MLSILARSIRAKTGETPPEEMAAINGERSTMAGKIKISEEKLLK